MVVQVAPQGNTIVFDGSRKTEAGFCAWDASIPMDSSNKSRLRNIGIWIKRITGRCVLRQPVVLRFICGLKIKQINL
jgi:hypothetical protein